MNNDGTVTVTQGDFYTVTQASGSNMAVITVKDRPMTFSVIKQNTNGEPLEDAHFDLYRQITIGGTSFIDFNPIPGYTNLTTGADGRIPLISQNLAPGTYYLKEPFAPNGYNPIEEPICFTIGVNGTVTLAANDHATLVRTDGQDGSVSYVLRITDDMMTLVPSDYKADKLPYILFGIVCLVLIAAAFVLENRKEN